MSNKEPFCICRSKLKEKKWHANSCHLFSLACFYREFFLEVLQILAFSLFLNFFPYPSLILHLDSTKQLHHGSGTVSFANCLPRLWLIQTVGLLENNTGIYQGIFPNGNSVHFLLKIAWIPTFLEQYLLLFQIIRGKNTGIKM